MSAELSVGALCGIVVAGVVLVALAVWLSTLCELYFFYALPPEQRPQEAFNATQNDVCHLACIRLNLSILHSCCPELKTDAHIFSEKEILIRPPIPTGAMTMV